MGASELFLVQENPQQQLRGRRYILEDPDHGEGNAPGPVGEPYYGQRGNHAGADEKQMGRCFGGAEGTSPLNGLKQEKGD